MSYQKHHKITRSVLLVCTLCFAILNSADAQRVGRITGTVLDAITGDPVQDATVGIHGTDRTTGTNELGQFVLENVTPGLVRLSTQILGYLPITTDYYTVRPDTSIEVDFRLAPAVYEVEGVQVTGINPTRRYSRVQGAAVLTREQLPKRGNILNALQGTVPSVRTRGSREDTRLVVRGAQADVLYVLDGQVLRPPLTFYIDAQDVDCVEIRKGFSAVQEFKPPGDGEVYAGVVLIFTRGSIGPRPASCSGGGS